MFKYTDLSLRGEVYLNMNSDVLELKLHKVQFADKLVFVISVVVLTGSSRELECGEITMTCTLLYSSLLCLYLCCTVPVLIFAI